MRRTIRSRLAVLLPVFALLPFAIGPAGAQAPAPREIPEGFVLPGPAPTGGAAPAAPRADEAPAARVPLGASTGAAVPAQTFVLPNAGVTTLLSSGASAARHDWPCVQRRIDHVDERQVWTGPELGASAAVAPNEATRQLAAAIAQRRVPLGEAEAKAAGFVTALPESEREAAATALYGELFRRLNAERSEIMRGIERYGAKQQDLANRLRETNAALGAIRAKGDAAKAAEAEEALLWDTRIFDERRRSLTYVCEVPTLIEQRMFGLGRALAKTF